jgi:hypothetical protein
MEPITNTEFEDTYSSLSNFQKISIYNRYCCQLQSGAFTQEQLMEIKRRIDIIDQLEGRE